MERAWRIDPVLDTLSGSTAYEVVSQTSYEELNVNSSSHLAYLFGLASQAAKEGDREFANELRKEAAELKKDTSSVKFIEDEPAADIISWLVREVSKTLTERGHAFPTRFLSVDVRDPKELLDEAASSFDVETVISGLYRRTRDRLIRGDKDHLHCSIREATAFIAPESLASITSIESWPFYVDRPGRTREIRGIASDIVSDMTTLVGCLKTGGEYMTFPWGEIPFLGDGEEELMARIARKQLIPEVERSILPLTFGGKIAYLTQRYAQEEVHSWMTDGEYRELAPRSPAFTEENETEGFQVLRLQKTRGRRRGNASAKPLLGPRQ